MRDNKKGINKTTGWTTRIHNRRWSKRRRATSGNAPLSKDEHKEAKVSSEESQTPAKANYVPNIVSLPLHSPLARSSWVSAQLDPSFQQIQSSLTTTQNACWGNTVSVMLSLGILSCRSVGLQWWYCDWYPKFPPLDRSVIGLSRFSGWFEQASELRSGTHKLSCFKLGVMPRSERITIFSGRSQTGGKWPPKICARYHVCELQQSTRTPPALPLVEMYYPNLWSSPSFCYFYSLGLSLCCCALLCLDLRSSLSRVLTLARNSNTFDQMLEHDILCLY